MASQAKSNSAKNYLSPKGRKTATELFEPGGAERMESHYRRRAVEVDESWARQSAGFVMNGMYSRGVLSTGTRELCAVAALTAIGRLRELKQHIRMALRCNRASHVREAILQMAVYAGMPAALDGYHLFEGVIREPEFKRKAATLQRETRSAARPR